MVHQFDRNMARLALEICRFTYAAGIGNAANAPDRAETLAYIKTHSNPLADPIPIVGGETSFACVVPYVDCNVVSYMGTKTEFRVIKLSEFIDLLKNGNALTVALQARGFVQQFLQSLEDWGQNGRARPVPFHLNGAHIGRTEDVILEGRVHDGFLSELKAVQAEVVATLKELKREDGTNRKVLVTGHSQGGAEAALATRALAAAGFDVEVTYTFAAPRTGTQQFADSVTTPVHRIEFGDDIVPHLPPTVLSNSCARHRLISRSERGIAANNSTAIALDKHQIAGELNAAGRLDCAWFATDPLGPTRPCGTFGTIPCLRRLSLKRLHQPADVRPHFDLVA